MYGSSFNFTGKFRAYFHPKYFSLYKKTNTFFSGSKSKKWYHVPALFDCHLLGSRFLCYFFGVWLKGLFIPRLAGFHRTVQDCLAIPLRTLMTCSRWFLCIRHENGIKCKTVKPIWRLIIRALRSRKLTSLLKSLVLWLNLLFSRLEVWTVIWRRWIQEKLVVWCWRVPLIVIFPLSSLKIRASYRILHSYRGGGLSIDKISLWRT